jgi:hypothetical protein
VSPLSTPPSLPSPLYPPSHPLLSPPPLSLSLSQELNPIDPDAICAALRFTRTALATALRPELQSVYESLQSDEPYAVTGEQVR